MPKTEIAVTVTVIETWFLLIAGDAQSLQWPKMFGRSSESVSMYSEIFFPYLQHLEISNQKCEIL